MKYMTLLLCLFSALSFGAVTVSWDAPTLNVAGLSVGSLDYQVNYTINGAASVQASTSGATSFSFAAAAGDIVTASVIAIDGYNQSAPSIVASLDVPDLSPLAPTNLALTYNGANVIAGWDAPTLNADGGPVGTLDYQVNYSINGVPSVQSSTSGGTSFAFPASAGDLVEVSVIAIDGGIYGAESTVETLTVPDLSPLPPTNVTITTN